MRQNAEAAGFNPLTALRAGGGAGFTTTHHPALASGEFIAQAIGGVGNAIASIDPMRDQTAKLEHQIKQATLANIQADTAAAAVNAVDWRRAGVDRCAECRLWLSARAAETRSAVRAGSPGQAGTRQPSRH